MSHHVNLKAIDWTSPTPPPGYIPGVGRGAKAFVTSYELKSIAEAHVLSAQTTTSSAGGGERRFGAGLTSTLEIGSGSANHGSAGNNTTIVTSTDLAEFSDLLDLAALGGNKKKHQRNAGGTSSMSFKTGQQEAREDEISDSRKRKRWQMEKQLPDYDGMDDGSIDAKLVKIEPLDFHHHDNQSQDQNQPQEKKVANNEEDEDDDLIRQEREKLRAKFADVSQDLKSMTNAERESLRDLGTRVGSQRHLRQQQQPMRGGAAGGGFASSSSLVSNSRVAEALQNEHRTFTLRGQQQLTLSVLAEDDDNDGAALGAQGKKQPKGKVDPAGGASNLKPQEEADSGNDPSSSTAASTYDADAILSDLDALLDKEFISTTAFSFETKFIFQDRVDSNPSEAKNWIMLARLQRQEGKVKASRKTLDDGCASAAGKKSDSIWLEAIQYAPTTAEKRAIAENAVKAIPDSERLWIVLGQFQPSTEKQLDTLREAVMALPEKEHLWVQLLRYEDPNDHALILKEALKAAGSALPMLWSMLAELESKQTHSEEVESSKTSSSTSSKGYETGRRLYNAAVKKNPMCVYLWVKAALFEERHHHYDLARRIIKEGVRQVKENFVSKGLPLQFTAEDSRYLMKLRSCGDEAALGVEGASGNSGRGSAGGILDSSLDEEKRALVQEQRRITPNQEWIRYALQCCSTTTTTGGEDNNNHRLLVTPRAILESLFNDITSPTWRDDMLALVPTTTATSSSNASANNNNAMVVVVCVMFDLITGLDTPLNSAGGSTITSHKKTPVDSASTAEGAVNSSTTAPPPPPYLPSNSLFLKALEAHYKIGGVEQLEQRFLPSFFGSYFSLASTSSSTLSSSPVVVWSSYAQHPPYFLVMSRWLMDKERTTTESSSSSSSKSKALILGLGYKILCKAVGYNTSATTSITSSSQQQQQIITIDPPQRGNEKLWVELAIIDTRLKELESVQGALGSPSSLPASPSKGHQHHHSGGHNKGGAREILQQGIKVLSSPSSSTKIARKDSPTKNHHSSGGSTAPPAGGGGGLSWYIYLKSAMLERCLGNLHAAKTLVDEGLTQFPRASKLWMMCLQLVAAISQEQQASSSSPSKTAAERAMGPMTGSIRDPSELRSIYHAALDTGTCGHDPLVWVEAGRVEALVIGQPHQARALLDQGLTRLPRSEVLWVARVGVELRYGTRAEALNLAQQGLAQCAQGGSGNSRRCAHLCACVIDLEPPMTRPRRARDILKFKCADPPVLLAISRIYYQARVFTRAVEEVEKAICLDPKDGDAWVLLYFYATDVLVQNEFREGKKEEGTSNGQRPQGIGGGGSENGTEVFTSATAAKHTTAHRLPLPAPPSVLARCVKAMPNKGFYYLPAAKDPVGLGLDGHHHSSSKGIEKVLMEATKALPIVRHTALL